ncbi:MAG: amino acid adenylation domain-containing protein, partial [Candidatus Aminicenantes bacterium]|nr:amino acid adenylation domain-containing protein [Candidatus Aminicenantes bacterium]
MKKNHFQARLCESLRSCRDRIALEYGDRFLSYAELDISSDSVANLIIREGIKKETFIGISFDDRVSFIRTLIGILKAGCVFVPLDLAHPDSRLTQMVKKTHIKYAFTDTGRIAFLTADWGITNLSEIEEIPESNSKPGRLYNGEDKIYIYFTSGSSGTPKAIVGKNKSLLHFINWEIDTFGIDETFRFSQFINPGFDAFLRDIFVPLCSGGRVCIPGSDNILLNSDELTRWTDRSAVNAIHCVPGFFRLLNNNNLGNGLFKNLKFVFLSGEKINPAGLVNWYNTFGERIRLVNFYGPSETTMIKTFYPIRQEDTKRERIPIGKPMKGARLIILDRKMKTCTGKRVGEIYIRTPFRTHGYYNERSLNEEKFISNPFNDDPEDKLYATGDIGRVLPGGDFELLGRNDRQVKIRGVRVELEEIENVLEKHPRVNEAVALKEEISSFNEQLCLFITTDRQVGENEDADIAILKEYIKQELPAYMAPTRVEQVNEIPRNPNGKIDYKSLHSLLEAGLRDVVPPGNSMERRMRNIWSELLGIEEDNIGIRNSFLELGGNSLNAMTLSARVHREFHVRLSLAELFEHVTIEEQADRIRAASTEIYQSIKNAEEKEYYPLSSAQNRLFVVQQMEHGNTGYNTQTFVRLKGEVKREEFSRAFHKLIERHESLRTSFFMVAEVPVQKIHRPKEIEFEIEYFEASKSVRARRAVPGDQETGIIDRFVRPFDLSRAPLLRAGLIDTGSDEHILMVDMHHIAADGVSHGILIRDFTFLYEGRELHPLQTRYRDFSEWQKNRKQVETGQLKKQEEFWLGEFPGDIPVLNLPTDYVRPALQSFEGRVVRFTIAGNEKKALNRLALEQEVTLYMIVLALFNVLLAKLSGQEDIVVGSPTAGRDHADLQKVIGMFVNTLTLRSHPVAEKTFIDFLKEVKEKTLRAFENQDYPF